MYLPVLRGCIVASALGTSLAFFQASANDTNPTLLSASAMKRAIGGACQDKACGSEACPHDGCSPNSTCAKSGDGTVCEASTTTANRAKKVPEEGSQIASFVVAGDCGTNTVGPVGGGGCPSTGGVCTNSSGCGGSKQTCEDEACPA